MIRKEVESKALKSEERRRGAEKGRKEAESKRAVAEKARERAEAAREASADDIRIEEGQRKAMEELRTTAEDFRRIAEDIRQASMLGMESQERRRESAELLRVDRIGKVLEGSQKSIATLHQETTRLLKDMRKMSKSAKGILRAMQEMLQTVSEQMKKDRS